MFKTLSNILANIFINKIKNMSKDVETQPIKEPEYDEIGTPIRSAMDQLDFTKFNFSLPVDLTKITENDKTLLIVDDIDMTELLYKSDFNKIKKQYNKDILKDFFYIPCFMSDAGLCVYDLLFNKKIRIDYAVLDLTLGYDFKLPNGEYVQLDGVDLANYLLQANKDVKFIFCSAHTMNINNSVIKLYSDKYRKLDNINLEDKFICKNSNRIIGLYNLLYKG